MIVGTEKVSAVSGWAPAEMRLRSRSSNHTARWSPLGAPRTDGTSRSGAPKPLKRKQIQIFSKMQEECWKDLWLQPCHAKERQHSSLRQLRAGLKIGNGKEFKTMYGCMVESHESTRQWAESLQPKIMKIALQVKDLLRLNQYHLVHKFIPMPQGMRIPDAKSAVDKEWKKLETSHAWNLKKIKGNKEVILDAQKRRKESPLCFTDGDMSPHKRGVGTKITNVQRQSRTLEPRIFFVEQGSSACQMTAAKIMDVVPRLSGSDGQAADAVSGNTQVELEDAPKLLEISKSECSDIWIRLPRHKWHKSWTKIEDPVVLLYAHPLAGLLWERPFEKACKKPWMGENSELGMCVSFFGNNAFLSVFVDDIRMAGKKLEELLNNVDIDEPTSFLNHVYLGCTGTTEKLPWWHKSHAQTLAWSYDMEGHAQKCVERYGELANKKVEQLKKKSYLRSDYH